MNNNGFINNNIKNNNSNQNQFVIRQNNSNPFNNMQLNNNKNNFNLLNNNNNNNFIKFNNNFNNNNFNNFVPFNNNQNNFMINNINNNNINIMPLNNQRNHANNIMFNNQNNNNIQNNQIIRSNSSIKLFECPKCHQIIEERLKEDHKLSHRIDENEKRKWHRRHQSRDERHFRHMNNNRQNRFINNINNINPRDNNHFDIRNFDIEQLYEFVNGYYRNKRHHSNHALSLPEIVIEDVNKLDEANKSCMICLEEFKSKEKVVALPCLHLFHKKCIKKWMERKKECPVCKFELTRENIDQKMKDIYH